MGSRIWSVLLHLLFLSCGPHPYQSTALIPPKYDGFVFGGITGKGGTSSTIMVEAFLDPVCPDSRDSWPPLVEIVHRFSPYVSLTVHPFPLPYHDNSFLSCHALHIANKLNESATFPLLELFFKYQPRYYNDRTRNIPKAEVIKLMADLAVEVVGNSSKPAFEDGFYDPNTDMAARISFKYGCSRGVTGTPYFLVNGFALPGAGSVIDYGDWKSIIDPLIPDPEE